MLLPAGSADACFSPLQGDVGGASLRETVGESASPLRVLVIEDDRDALSATVEMLKLLGHWAAGVSSAEAALYRFLEGAFDVLLVDVHLPGLSGPEVVRRLRERERLPVIFASGAVRPLAATLEDALWLGKPYTAAQLQAAITACRDRLVRFRPPPGPGVSA